MQKEALCFFSSVLSILQQKYLHNQKKTIMS
jgi:hypothetical protein